MSNNFVVPRIEPGTYNGCKVVVSRSSNRIVFIAHNSSVYHARKEGFLNISREWQMNDQDRQAFCQCSGISFAEVAAARKKQRELSDARQLQMRLDRFRCEAAALGYELVEG